jgi:hypothetical protein
LCDSEDIKALNDGLEKLQAEKGLDIKIHVDAGSWNDTANIFGND